MALKKKLVKYIRDKFTQQWLRNQGDPAKVMSIIQRITPNALMIGFCRRFATYKRAHLLFTDLDRPEKIVNDPDRPVLFFFSGKAHPADGAGQGLIKRIFEISRMPQFLGKIIFLEDYDMRLARRLVSGVDIRMNTPTRPAGGQWHLGREGRDERCGQPLRARRLVGGRLPRGCRLAPAAGAHLSEPTYQDQLDAATIYSLLENDIIPLYFNRGRKAYPLAG